jgi:hypothetical protein
MLNQCQGCGAEVIWTRTKSTGQKIPLDAEPVWIRLDRGGHIYLQKDGTVLRGYEAGDADDDPDSNLIEAHRSHFATCPVGANFRKRRNRA